MRRPPPAKRAPATADLEPDTRPIPEALRDRIIDLGWNLHDATRPLEAVNYEAKPGERGELRKAIRKAKAILEKMEVMLR